MQKFTNQLLRFYGLIAMVFVFQYANAQCTANFTFTVNQATKTVTFTNTSTSADSNYYWRFGDISGFFVGKNPVYTYKNAGSYTVCVTRTGPACYDTVCKTVTILPDSCDAGFTFTVNDATKTVTFTNTSTGADSNYIWNFNPGSSTAKNPVHTYASEGTYTVCLIKPACNDTICKTVYINRFCNLSFIYSVNQATKTVTFNNLSTGDSSYLWRFGDNTTSGVKNPVKTYGAAGTYTVCLKRSGPICFDSLCKTVTISNSCNINFTFSTNNATKTVTFTNTSTGTDSSFLWRFGDNTTSGVKNPVKTYGAPGTYTVCLKRSGPVCFDSICKTVTITNVCSVGFTFSVNNTTKTVTFNNTSIGPDSSFLWRFGDNTTSGVKHPVKTYGAAGTYTVCLKQLGPICYDSICKTVTIVADTCTENANFTYSINHATRTVTFTNTSTGPIDSNYLWYFGSTGTSTLKNPVHTFGSAGTYMVCLYKFGNICWDSTCKLIKIDSVLPCDANFTYSVNQSTKTVTFTNTSISGSDSTYLWRFGDNTSSTQKNPVKTYASGGSYIVCLFMNGPVCFDSICKTVNIVTDTCNENANFTYSVNHTTRTVTFNNTSTGTVDSNYLWYFGFSGTSTAKNPVYTFGSAGTYMVCLYKFGTSCWDSVCKVITIDSLVPCQASFTHTYDSLTGNLNFNNTSTGSGLTYLWTFGGPNGGTSTTKNPSYHYPYNGTYTICLKITRTNPACTSTICDTITINQGPNLCRPITYMTQDSFNRNKYNFFAYVGGGSPNYYFWDFGDGDTSTQQGPQHTYSHPGMYYVCVTTMRFDGCISKVCDTIYVSTDSTLACHADFDYTLYPDSFDGVNRIAVFNNLSTGNHLIYHWSFGDGDMSNSESPIHYYDSNGVFYVCLVVRDTAGTCFDTICKSVYIVNDTTTGMSTLSNSLNDFKVYPVPFNDALKIRFTSRTDKPVSIRIYNTLGILQHEEARPANTGTNEYEVNAERLVKGVYFIELSNGDGTITKRTIK